MGDVSWRGNFNNTPILFFLLLLLLFLIISGKQRDLVSEVSHFWTPWKLLLTHHTIEHWWWWRVDDWWCHPIFRVEPSWAQTWRKFWTRCGGERCWEYSSRKYENYTGKLHISGDICFKTVTNLNFYCWTPSADKKCRDPHISLH